jgi:hypothetical protein
MSLHPIRELNRVIEEYKEYLRTEFRAKDERLRAALDLELERPLFSRRSPSSRRIGLSGTGNHGETYR